jgi:isochorismate pyruvate lyase
VNPPTKQPDECKSLQDIRTQIDRLDRQIVALLGQRLEYVHAAAAFKTSETTVRAPDRVASMLDDRRRWAIEDGLEAEAISRLYEGLIEYFTNHEMQVWSGGDSPDHVGGYEPHHHG